ncbi:zinc-binding dehydrogenase [Cryobacterium algoritolerans]|uniref:zinc-binding dehydrogenase n=1 Tax=Cryobacterium algoritolerans TaxID=1259184 RepID=UPI0018E09A1B|nr:zinc-binding dehydrogenase [Cryobacterium algoritolerans]
MTAVRGTANVVLVRGLGADRVLDCPVEDFTGDTQVYDVVLDAVGTSSFGRCRPLLNPGGIYLSTEWAPSPGSRSSPWLVRCMPKRG